MSIKPEVEENKYCFECLRKRNTKVELRRIAKTFFQECMIVSRAVCPVCGLLQYKRERDTTPIRYKVHV